MPYGQEKSVGFVRSADEVLDRFDGDAGGHFARRVSAHAVGDDEQPQILGADEAVFVHATNGAGLTQAECRHDVLARAESTTRRRGRYYFSGSAYHLVGQWRLPRTASSGQLADQQRPRVDADLLEDARQMLLGRRRA